MAEVHRLARAFPGSARQNVGETERWVSAAAAGALVGWAVAERNRRSWWAAAAGAALALRAGTGYCPAYAAAGIDTRAGAAKRALSGAGGIHVHEETTIGRPVSEVYEFWRTLENLPTVMRHIRSVTTDGTRSHWVAEAPAGLTVEWDAEIIHDERDRLIGWRSLDGSTVAAAGSVHFEPIPGGATRVWVRFQYDPPGGRLGAWFAGLVGQDPAAQVREDLQRLKERMESHM